MCLFSSLTSIEVCFKSIRLYSVELSHIFTYHKTDPKPNSVAYRMVSAFCRLIHYKQLNVP